MGRWSDVPTNTELAVEDPGQLGALLVLLAVAQQLVRRLVLWAVLLKNLPAILKIDIRPVLQKKNAILNFF